MIYRAETQCSIWVEALGRDVHIRPADQLDDTNPADAEIIKAGLAKGVIRADNPIEAATAVPGEQRSTRRKTAA